MPRLRRGRCSPGSQPPSQRPQTGPQKWSDRIKIARDTAVKARSSAIIALKALIVNAPGELRETLEPLTDRQLIKRCADLEPGDLIDPTASIKHALRALATRWLTLSTEIGAHDEALDTLTMAAAPSLREAYGIGPDSAAEMMIVAGDNPARIRSEAAFAKLCGACPIPASTGITNRHRLFRGGHRQANAALYRIVIVRMRWHQPTLDYVIRRTGQGLSKKDIIRCLKRFVAREIYNALIGDHRSRTARSEVAWRAATTVLTYRGVNAVMGELLLDGQERAPRALREQR